MSPKSSGAAPTQLRVIVGYLEQHGADLIVLATHHRGSDWLHKSISEPVVRKAGEMTLFLPEGVRGFVSLDRWIGFAK